jgi:hypothetical protein
MLTACNATFSPLVRGAHYGSPGRLDEGQLEISGTAGGVIAPGIGGPQLAYGVSDWLSLEAGGNFSLAANQQNWAMGYFGPRLTYALDRQSPVHFVSDLELGVGLGVGGALHDNESKDSFCQSCDASTWNQRFSYGSYQGIGVGGRFHWFSLFVRARVEESVASGIPLTLWPSAMLGLEFDFSRRAALGLGGGFMAYVNDIDKQYGWFYQASLTVFLDVRKRAK